MPAGTSPHRYDHDDGLQQSEGRAARQSEAKRAKREREAMGRERKQSATAAERAEERFNRHKQLVIALGDHVYLRLQVRDHGLHLISARFT